jgi:hypothetical protein
MPDAKPSPEVEALVQGYVDGSLAPDECRRLHELLREKPELNHTILAELRMDLLIQAAVRQDAAAEEPASGVSPCPLPPAAGRDSAVSYSSLNYDAHGRARRSRAWRVWPIAAGFAFVLGASVWFAAGRAERFAPATEMAALPGTARLTASSGTVAVERAGRRFKPREGLLLHAGDAVITGAGSLARLEYSGEQSWIEVASETELRFAHEGEGKRLELRRGRFEAEVAPQPAGRPMICLTPQGRATVLGTRFFLTALEQQEWLEVLRGTVQLAGDGSTPPAEVNEGERAVVAGGPRPALERIGGRGIFEAESLDIVSSYGGNIIGEFDPNASGNYHRVLHATRAGGSISYGIPIDTVGRYVMHLRFNQRSNRGIYQLFVNGEPRAEPFDFSRRGNTHRFLELEFCTFEVTEPGTQVFTFENRGRAAHGNSHKLSIDYFKLVRVADDTGLAVVPAPADYASQALTLDFNALAITASTRDGATVESHPSAAGGEWLRYNGDEPGDKVTFRVNVPAAGTYRIAAQLWRQPAGGIVQVAADDGNLSFVNVGGRLDLYGASEAAEIFELGTVTFAGAGPKQFRFEVRGRNPASSGFGIGLDMLILRRTP